MKPLASMLVCVCLILVAMSPAAMEAFGQITGAVILSGTMDLGDEIHLFAVGMKDGLCWEISCKWVGGRPQCLVFANPRTIL